MAALIKLCTLIVLSHLLFNNYSVYCQRSHLHWKQDLEYRLNSYLNQRDTIQNILTSSIYPTVRDSLEGPAAVRSGGNVRFSDLIIPTGSLMLSDHVARPTVTMMNNRTLNYVNSKVNDLNQIQIRLDNIQKQLDDSRNRFIYKGLPRKFVNSANVTTKIPGTWIFKQVNYGNVFAGNQVNLKRINSTSVDHVIRETYMENAKFGLRDSQQRLFFEGKKTFWRSVFMKKLNSGCCNRLKPLHTDRMMTRIGNQDIFAPVMFHTNALLFRGSQPVIVHRLKAETLLNRILTFAPILSPNDVGLLQTPAENPIQLNNLINTRQQNQPEIFKTIVFKDILMVDDVNLQYSIGDRKLLIGFASNPNFNFDLAHENYLLKYQLTRNLTTQYVAGTTIVSSEAHFINNLNASSVNMVPNFYQNLVNNIVRTDRPAIIRSPIQFNAIPAVLSLYAGPSRAPQNVLIMSVDKELRVGSLNGMNLPLDIVLLGARKPFEPIIVRGSRQFINRLAVNDFLNVHRLVNGMRMPQDVIPLHLNDAMGSLGYTNLAFLDGIVAQHITIQGGQFDNIVLRDAYGDAQSLIMRSIFMPQPDGSQLIQAPLRIANLNVFGQTSDTGLINGFKPQHLIELTNLSSGDSIYGNKQFLAPVEAGECIFHNINHLSNWTNHLIRIDRPNTIQTVDTKLAFVKPPIANDNLFDTQNVININRLSINFYPNNNPVQYMNNINFSPEFYNLQQALLRAIVNHTESRYRVLDQVRIINPEARINGIDLNDVVTLDVPFRFADKFVMVGKVEIKNSLSANRITSNYPIDAMDLVQFDRYRIPIIGSRAPIRMNNLVLSNENKASYVQSRMLNGISFTEFANSIMSLTRPQVIDNGLVFNGPVNFEGLIRTESSLNGVKQFKRFATNIKNAKYSFENGLQCNSVMIKV